MARLLLVSPMAPTRAFIDERRVRLLALLGEVDAARQRQIREQMARADDVATVALCREFSDLTFRLYLSDPTPEKLRHAQARCDIPPAAIRNRFVVEAATMRSLGDWDWGPMLAAMDIPALVLEGSETKVPLEPTRLWAMKLPRSRLLLIPRAGHEMFVDEPAAFLEAAEQFLGGTHPPAARSLRTP